MAFGVASRYITPHLLPRSDESSENRLQLLVNLGKRLGQAVLYPLSDDDVILCSRERQTLRQYYLFVMPDHVTVMNLLAKDGLTRVAQSCGVCAPQMAIPRDLDQVEALTQQLSYPVLIKPMISPSWLRPEIISLLRDDPLSGPPKVAFCPDAETLVNLYRQIAIYDSRVIIQEVIPGEDERLVYFCFYLDRHGKPLATFAGRKLRVLPVGFGSASYVRSFRDPELEQVSLQLLNAVGYQGLGGVEFKKDSRDERYKLIEFNVRFGMWDALGVRCGIDIPYLSYRDAIGMPVEPQHDYRTEVAWVDLQRDIRAFLIYRRQRKLGWAGWLQSLRGEKDWAVYARDDWKPALFAAGKLFERPWNGIKKKVLGRIWHAPNGRVF